MKNRWKRLCPALIAGALCFAALGGALAQENRADETEVQAQNGQNDAVYMFPMMGMDVRFPGELFERMERNEMTLIIDQTGTDDGSALRCGVLSFNTVRELPEGDADGWPWELTCAGVLGVYRSELIGELDELTGCDVHKQLGQSQNGMYAYYLSTNSEADPEVLALLRRIEITVTEMEAFVPPEEMEEMEASPFTGTSLGEFTAQDIEGKTYTQAMFADYELTMVNVFTTWCTPCVAEIPDLEKLHVMMAERGVNVVGVVLDVLDEKGEIQPESLEKAKLLAERTGATYPFLLPDETYMNGRLMGIEAFPETFFVDRGGNIVGETYSGSRGLEDWVAIVEAELSRVQEGA